MRTLQVPENISLRWEAWRGFGAPELVKSLVITSINLVISIVLVQAGVMPIILAVGVVIFTFAICVSLLSKIENNQSIVDYIHKAAKYKKEQQLFQYRKIQEEEITQYGEEAN